jgi:hypothetical protein
VFWIQLGFWSLAAALPHHWLNGAICYIAGEGWGCPVPLVWWNAMNFPIFQQIAIE